MIGNTYDSPSNDPVIAGSFSKKSTNLNSGVIMLKVRGK